MPTATLGCPPGYNGSRRADNWIDNFRCAQMSTPVDPGPPLWRSRLPHESCADGHPVPRMLCHPCLTSCCSCQRAPVGAFCANCTTRWRRRWSFHGLYTRVAVSGVMRFGSRDLACRLSTARGKARGRCTARVDRRFVAGRTDRGSATGSTRRSSTHMYASTEVEVAIAPARC